MPIRRPPDYALIRRSRRARRIPRLPLAALLAVVIAAAALLVLSRWALSPAPEGARARWAYVLDGQTAAGERSGRAADLLAAGLVDSVICGGNPVGGEVWGSTLSARRVLSLAQPDPVRVSEFRLGATSTVEEAMQLVPLFRALGADTIALVTSNYHTRRALSVFRRVAGGDPAFIAFAAHGPDFPSPWWRSRYGRRTWLIETTKNAYWHLIEKWATHRLPDDAPVPAGAFVRAPEAGILPGSAPCPAQSASQRSQPAIAPAASTDSGASRQDSTPEVPAPPAAADEPAAPAPPAATAPSAPPPSARAARAEASTGAVRKTATVAKTTAAKGSSTAAAGKAGGSAKSTSDARATKQTAKNRKR